MNNIQLGQKLYKALGEGDVPTLLDIWSPDFTGDLTPGLPLGMGAKTKQGRDAFLAYFGEVGQHFMLVPTADEILYAEPYLIGRGYYNGHAVSTGKPVRARFAHFWTVRGDQISGVIQVTDTSQWVNALS